MAPKKQPNPLASDFVRGCCERLRQIEGRLDHGCTTKWLAALDAVEDVLGVAAQLLPLRLLTKHDDTAGQQVPWLKQAVGASGVADDQRAELSRRVIQLIDEVDKAVPPARNPVDMLGECVLKHFDGHGTFMGTIVEYDQHTGFRVQFDDGDTEDLSLRDLRALMPNLAGECSGGTGDPWPPPAPPPKKPKASAGPSAKKQQQQQQQPQPQTDSDDTAAVGAADGGGKAAPAGVAAGERGRRVVRRRAEARARRGLRLRSRRRRRALGETLRDRRRRRGGTSHAIARAAAKAALPKPPPKPPPPPAPAIELTPEEQALLPPGWEVEAKGKNKVFVSPDGTVRLSTLAKVQRWHKQQMAIAARFQGLGAQSDPPAPAPAPARARARPRARARARRQRRCRLPSGGASGAPAPPARSPSPRRCGWPRAERRESGARHAARAAQRRCRRPTAPPPWAASSPSPRPPTPPRVVAAGRSSRVSCAT